VGYASAQREASDKAPDVLAALSRAREAHDSGPVPYATPNPRLTVGTSEYGARESVLFYAFLPFFGRRQAAVKASDALASIADANITVARLDARLAVSFAWIDLWLAERNTQIAELSRARRDRLLAIALERVDAGSAPKLDAIRARADALRQRAEVEALIPLQRAASARLAFLLGRDPRVSSLETDGSPPSSGAVPSLEVLVPKLKDHPVFLAAETGLKAQGTAVKTQRRLLLPFIGVQAGDSWNETFPLNGQPGGPRSSATGGVMIEFPVYGVSQLKRARAAQHAAQDNVELAMRRLIMGVVEAHAQLEAAARRVRSAADEILPSMRETSQLASEAYEEGSLDMTSVITSEQAYADAQLAVAQAEAALARASAQLGHAIGEQP
jgi:cobalt-zinc-cadmium efflux system outer membrane protein